MYMAVLVGIVILFLLCIILAAVCVTRNGSKEKRTNSARKRSPGGPGGDLWINQTSGSHMRGARKLKSFSKENASISASDYMVDALAATHLTERLTTSEVVESPPPRYQPLHGRFLIRFFVCLVAVSPPFHHYTHE